MAVIELSDSNQNKLGIVNRCLQAIGEAPLPLGTIPSEFPLGSDTQVAASIVDDTWIEVQNRGWWFNTEEAFKLSPDSNGFISLPPTVLRIDSGRYLPYIKKNGMVYNKDTHSFIFESPINLDLVWAVSYSDLPIAAYEYIACRASRKFQQKVIGSANETQFLQQEEVDALVNMQRENAQYLDSSLIETQVSRRWANPIRGL